MLVPVMLSGNMDLVTVLVDWFVADMRLLRILHKWHYNTVVHLFKRDVDYIHLAE